MKLVVSHAIQQGTPNVCFFFLKAWYNIHTSYWYWKELKSMCRYNKLHWCTFSYIICQSQQKWLKTKKNRQKANGGRSCLRISSRLMLIFESFTYQGQRLWGRYSTSCVCWPDNPQLVWTVCFKYVNQTKTSLIFVPLLVHLDPLRWLMTSVATARPRCLSMSARLHQLLSASPL